MTIHYRIISAITDGTDLTIVAKCREQIGTRKGEGNIDIPIYNFRNVSVVICIEDLPENNKLTYIQQQVEAAYAALPNETLVKQLIGKTWSS